MFASPHSGRLYPDDMMAAPASTPHAIRRSEDAFVDDLIAAGAAAGRGWSSPARFARAYIDLNREPYELDPAMFDDELPEFARGRTARVAAGLGAIARVVAEGQEIYARKLTFAEARAPDRAGAPALSRRPGPPDRRGAGARTASAILIDWHSMPAGRGAGRRARRRLRHRAGRPLRRRLRRPADRAGWSASLEALGYRVARNTPYAGGYTTEHYGRPAEAHPRPADRDQPRALPRRGDAARRPAGFEKLKADLERLTRALAAADWSALKSS